MTFKYINGCLCYPSQIFQSRFCSHFLRTQSSFWQLALYSNWADDRDSIEMGTRYSTGYWKSDFKISHKLILAIWQKSIQNLVLSKCARILERIFYISGVLLCHWSYLVPLRQLDGKKRDRLMKNILAMADGWHCIGHFRQSWRIIFWLIEMRHNHQTLFQTSKTTCIHFFLLRETTDRGLLQEMLQVHTRVYSPVVEKKMIS